MKKLKAALKAVFCLPPLPTVLLAAFGYGSLCLVFARDIQDPVWRYGSYLASTYALILTVTGLPYLLSLLKKGKERVLRSPLGRKLRATAAGEKYLTDLHFRNTVSLHVGLTVNLAYILVKLSAGIWYRSAWFLSLAAYYTLLAVMRLFLLRGGSGMDEAAAFRRYRFCGFVLLLMNQALAGIVVFMVRENRGFRYPGVLIYAIALYAFYAVITAVIDVVRTAACKAPFSRRPRPSI